MNEIPLITSKERLLRRKGVLWPLLIAGCLVGLGLAVVLTAQGHTQPLQPVTIGLLSILAAIGVVSLFAAAFGLVEFGAASPRDSMAGLIADTADEGFLVVEESGRVVHANATYRSMARVDLVRDVPSVERLLTGGADIGAVIYRLTSAVREGQTAMEEVRLARSLTEAGPAWYRVKASPMPQRKGLTLWSVSDITRQFERQESAFQELQYAIDFLDHAPAGFFSVNPDGEVVYLNATLAAWLGLDWAHSGSGGLKLSDILTASGLPLLTAPKGQAGDTKTLLLDVDLRLATGRSLPARLLHQISFDAAGRPGASRTLVLNRSAGEEADEGQRAAEVRFARFFNNSPFAIAMVARDGRIVRTNAPFARLLPNDVTVGETDDNPSIFVLVGETDKDALAQRIAGAAEGRSDALPVDLQLAVPERSARFYVTAADSGGADEDEAAIVYALDTTEQRALEAQFAQAQKMQAVGELAGGVAHDFNNVLQGILGYTDLLLTNQRPTDPSFHDIMQIKQNANRAAGLVRHLLAFSRRQTLRPETVQFTDVLSELSTLLKRLLGERIDLDIRHERDLWTVKADPAQFEQVIVNLAVNARDAMAQGGKFTIRTQNVPAEASAALGDKTIPVADYVMVEISDSGTGIPADILDKIFEPFFTTKEVGKGTGLGLSMVYGFVKQSGGYILCASTMGAGTTFRILLPRFIVEERAAVVEAAQAPKLVTDVTGSATVLLVEDEDAVRAFGARALSQRGYTVLEAASGVEALDILADEGARIDLIVSDVVMPEMDGPTMLREARARGITARIIFVSGYAEDAFRKNLPDGEEFGFLAKPFSLKQLIETVKAAIG